MVSRLQLHLEKRLQIDKFLKSVFLKQRTLSLSIPVLSH